MQETYQPLLRFTWPCGSRSVGSSRIALPKPRTGIAHPAVGEQLAFEGLGGEARILAQRGMAVTTLKVEPGG